MANAARHNSSCYCSHCGHIASKVLSLETGESQGGGVNRPSYLMHGSLRAVTLSNHPARLSVRWVTSGEYIYEVEATRFVLKPGNFLVLNNGLKYNAVSEPGNITENFTASFNPHVLSDVFQAFAEKEEWLLDNPFDSKDSSEIRFLINTYPVEGEIQKLLTRLTRESLNSFGTTLLDESFYLLIKQLLLEQGKIKRAAAKILSVKRSTREELYRRVSRARDFIRAHANQELKIEIIAAQANMSPYHFLRTYKQAFQITPHQELLSIRLQKARELMSICQREFSLARIAFDSGFSDLSSFSKAFKQKFGVAPSRLNSAAAETLAENNQT